jgi:hypothetical protein
MSDDPDARCQRRYDLVVGAYNAFRCNPNTVMIYFR